MSIDILDKFTTHLRNTLSRSIDLAWELQNELIPPVFLLLGLTEQHSSIGSDLLRRCQISSETLQTYIQNERLQAVTQTKKADGSEHPLVFLWPEFSPHTKKLIERATVLSFEFKHPYIGTEHLLLAMIEKPDELITHIFKEHHVAVDQVKQQLVTVMNGTSKFSDIQNLFSGNGSTQQAVGSVMHHDHDHDHAPEDPSDTPALDYFTSDLTGEQEREKLNPVIGREAEIQRVIHILSRRSKNNPVLIGDPGVGKTAIAEGLARRIAEGTVPDILLNKRVLALDLGLVLAGTMYRGEFESRMKQLIEELREHPEIILFIDEIHTIVGAGGVSGGTIDAANMLKPALARGDLRCIGATTIGEYRKHIENDPALERRFQPVQVDEPTANESFAILQGMRHLLQDYHHVTLSDEVLRAAVQLSIRYIPDRRLPDKALDLIDEAGAKARVHRTVPTAVKKKQEYQHLLQQIRSQKKQAVRSERYQLAVELKKKEVIVNQKLSELTKATTDIPVSASEVTTNDIAHVVTSMTGIPMDHIRSANHHRGTDIEQRIKKQIIGQDLAVDAVAAVLKRSYTGLTSPHRPIGSFLFLGPSGVGKTELAKVIASEVFGDRKALLRLDMSEYSEGFSVSKLIGAPAGYVGHKEGVKFIDHIRRKPYSVVLFDEIEKAHPDIFHLLLQILDEGRLTDSTGREVNFRNTIIILTSNVGIDQFTKQAEIGFAGIVVANTAFEAVESTILEELRNDFPAEFLNRIDQHIVFRPLTEPSIKRIVGLQWEQIQERLNEHHLNVRLLPSACALIAQKSFRPEEGARRISKHLTDLIENPLADKLMSGHYAPGDTIKIKRDKDAIVLQKEKKA